MLARVSVVVMGLLYVAAGLNHFRDAQFYMRIMPPWIPWHAPLVWLSGAIELVLGIGVLVPATRRWACWGLVALLMAVFPANVHAALHPETMGIPAWAAWARLPLQLPLIAWAAWHARLDSRNAAARVRAAQ
ncbi:MAG: DoxX family membrane protein [Sandaracinaceae bacterium]|nr:DoxX family membrane protein [Sandaracinaceae bacterium]